MGVSIAVSGSVKSPEARKDLLRWLEVAAADLDWSGRPVALAFKKGRVRAGVKTSPLELPRAAGISLLPHFACEELPFVFLEADGTLVEEVVEDFTSDSPTFLAGVLVKTQFAGPAVHREICEVLREIKTRFAPALTVDDETGFMSSGDKGALERGFAEGWADIRKKVEDDRPGPGTQFQIGGFPFEVPKAPAGGELDGMNEKQRGFILSCESTFVARFGGFGTTLDRSRASTFDLELSISDVDSPEVSKDPDDPALQDLALQAGAYFGRTVASVLGGSWRVDDGQFLLVDVGGCGLVVDPFEVARDRILNGPPYGFPNHLGVYETFAKHLAREDSA